MIRSALARRFGAALLLSALFAPAHAALPEPVARRLAEAKLPEDALAALVIRMPDGKAIVSHRDDAAMRPASVMKLVTTLVGLEQLGPAFRGRTELRTGAALSGDVLRGDLILRGGADADLTWEALEKMLAALRNQGIREIQGDLVLDRGLFNPAQPYANAPPFDETPEFAYNVIPDALLLNQNLLRLEIESDGAAIRVRATPQLDGLRVAADMQLVDASCPDWEDGWKLPTTSVENGRLNVVLHGAYPRHCAAATAINVVNRTDYAARLVRALWTKLGGAWTGGVREGAAPPDTRILAEHQARPLGEVLRDINKQSDNALARLLFLTLGSAGADPAAPSAAGAERAVRAWFAQHGIADAGMVLENGAGLSRIERISPRQLAGLLHAGAASNWAPEFIASLPIAGLDGTMRRRLQDSPAALRARMKTGTLRDTVCIAGYVRDANDVPYIVVGMINSDAAKSSVARQVIDALVDWVARQH